MSKKRWFRFFIERWRDGVFELKPLERYVYLEMLCELYNHDGFARLDEDVMARRCGMRPTSFHKALDALVAKGKIDIDRGFYTNRAVAEEIKTREKLAQKSEESRKKVAEKDNENNRKRRKVPPYTDNRKQIIASEDVSELSETITPSDELLRSVASVRRH